MLPNFQIDQVSALANSCWQLADFGFCLPQPAGSGLQPAPSGIPMFSGPGGLHLTWSFRQPAEDAGGPGPDIQKGKERRQKAACGAALWTLSADAAGHFPVPAPACLQSAEATKDLRALGCCKHRGTRGVSMRATFCSCCSVAGLVCALQSDYHSTDVCRRTRRPAAASSDESNPAS